MRRASAVILSCLFSSSSLLADSLSGNFITDRPSADRPKLPEFIPEKLPSFQLPPVETLIPKNSPSTVKIRLKGVKFTGNTVISDTQLQKIAQAYVGKPVLVGELEVLRQNISQYYSDQGYVNSGAVLPDQHFQDGIIHYQIIEGKLSQIRVSGTGWLRPDYVSERLQTKRDKPLNANELRQNFQQLLLDPLIERMNGNLVPGAGRGESILDVAVTRARPYQLTLDANNYRPPSIGSDQGKLSGWVRNLTGFGDTVDGNFLYSEGSLGGAGGFSVPLNAYDTRFNFHFDLNNVSVIEQTLKPIDIKSDYLAYDFSLIQPLIKNLNRNFNVGISFNVKENQTFLSDRPFSFSQGAVDGLTKDSALRFSLDFTERLEHHVFSARSTTSVGINAFNATWHNGSNLPDGDFVAWLGQLQYAGQVLDGTLILRGDLQYSEDKLIPMERFSLGGRFSVRGYRENELVRDRGYVLSAEFRYPLLSNDVGGTLPGQLTLFPFMDYGAGWNIGAGQTTDYLHSVGIGLAWQPIKRFTTEMMYAYALNTASAKSDYNLQDSGLHWGVSWTAF